VSPHAHDPHRRARRAVPIAAACALLAALSLGPVTPTAGASSSAAHSLRLTERDFRITSSSATVEAGSVVLHVHNAGPSTHEINIDRTNDAAGALPLKPDGLTVNEDAPSLHRIDSIEELNLGQSGDLTVHLKPGHYVFYCNLEGHYLGGMHLSLDVVGDHGS
jgi:uncharacterized cupredoxin-like copper-binding protein